MFLRLVPLRMSLEIILRVYIRAQDEDIFKGIHQTNVDNIVQTSKLVSGGVV